MLNKNIGKKLFDLRKQKSWSQEQTADYLNISRSAYQRIETGEGFSWASNLEKICEVFEIQPEQLLKQETLIVGNIGTNNGVGYAKVVNQLSEKLIEQYEARLKDKEDIIKMKDTIIDDLNTNK